MEKKTRMKGAAALAALVMVAAVISGCGNKPGVVDEVKEGKGGSGKSGSGRVEEAKDGVVNEFVKTLEIGRVYITVAEGVAMVRFDDRDGHVYVGSGAIGSEGLVSVQLEAVRDKSKVKVFEGVYHKAHEAYFLIKRLGGNYPLQEKVLGKQEVGTIPNVQQNEVRYVKDLKGGMSAVFTVTLTKEAVLVTAAYGKSRQIVTAETVLEGEGARLVMKLGEVEYELRLGFEASGKGWKLKKGAQGFALYEKAVSASYDGAMIEDTKKALAKVRLYKDSADAVQSENKAPYYKKSVGVLTVRMEGSMVRFTMEQNEHAESSVGIGGSALGAKAKQERAVRLVPMRGRPGLYESESLKSASVEVKKSATVSDGDYTVKAAGETVFAFVHTQAAGSGQAYKDIKYNTYDFKIREYNPETKQFVLEGEYLMGKKAVESITIGSATSNHASAGNVLLFESADVKKGLTGKGQFVCRLEGTDIQVLDGHAIQGE